MRITRIYIPQDLSENTCIDCPDQVSHYLKNVLRMKVGREVILFNGDGYDYSAVIDALNKKSVTISIHSTSIIESESPLSIHLGCCMIKNDRMDWLLQKATELGVTRFSPLISEYTDLKIPADRLQKKMEHWQQVVISACEQSGRAVIPKIDVPQSLSQWLPTLDASFKAVLHPYHAERLNVSRELDSVALLVGPEGGLTDAEVALSHTHGFQSIRLGPRILRAETAPLTAISLFQHLSGDM